MTTSWPGVKWVVGAALKVTEARAECLGGDVRTGAQVSWFPVKLRPVRALGGAELRQRVAELEHLVGRRKERL
jgi:hypothetical protein